MLAIPHLVFVLGLLATSLASPVHKRESGICQPISIPACTASWWHVSPSPKSITTTGHVFEGVNARQTTMDEISRTFTAKAGDIPRYFDVTYDDSQTLTLNYYWSDQTRQLRLPDAYITVIFLDDNGRDTNHRASYLLAETHELGGNKYCNVSLKGNPFHKFRVETSIRQLGNYVCGVPH